LAEAGRLAAEAEAAAAEAGAKRRMAAQLYASLGAVSWAEEEK